VANTDFTAFALQLECNFTYLHRNSQINFKKLKVALQNIPNLIFDLGGVIININFDLTMQALQAFAPEQHSLGQGAYLGKAPCFYEYETGQLSDEAFLEALAATYRLQASKAELRKAWNALLLDIPAARIELLRHLERSHRLFLLSNTNPLHFKEVEHILEAATGVARLSDLFEQVHLSYEMGLAKPEAEIYQEVLRLNGLKAEESLFIDDSPANIAAAAALGIHTLLVQPGHNSILDFFPAP
jgi:putative hydrolase of the HAD superfamily